ncbi:hypothetical protein B9Z19DRAFT_1126761 [Tuber borchii]|uniref:Uncharacterized protein n=1 Tax=Tuber borchii TaxID=42251 RepID=A0A2T6ZSI5_TUBBO|nr:hypothetical protein B9Z19DRAFT_1126761 [Tuber borchii]
MALPAWLPLCDRGSIPYGNAGGDISGKPSSSEWAARYVQGRAINLGYHGFALIAGVAIIRMRLSSAIKATGLWIDTPPFLDMLIGIADVTFAAVCDIEGVYPWKV